MPRYIKNKNGTFAGSIGDGKTKVPSVAEGLPRTVDINTGDTSPVNYENLHAAMIAAEEERVLERWSRIAERDAETTADLMRIINTHEQDAPTLFRGLPMDEHNLYLTPETLQPGQVLHLPPSSFSENRSVAEEFMVDPAGWGDDPTVLLMLEDGYGMPLGNTSAFPEQKEWLTHGEFEVVSVEEDPDREIDYLVTVRPTGERLEPAASDRVVLTLDGPVLVSTTEMTEATRDAYSRGQCWALAAALAENDPEYQVGVVVRGHSDIYPWGVAYDDEEYSPRGDRMWIDEGVHAVAVSADGSHILDVDGRRDMDAFREEYEDLHSGTLIVMSPNDMKSLVQHHPAVFPQDYETAALISALVERE